MSMRKKMFHWLIIILSLSLFTPITTYVNAGESYTVNNTDDYKTVPVEFIHDFAISGGNETDCTASMNTNSGNCNQHGLDSVTAWSSQEYFLNEGDPIGRDAVDTTGMSESYYVPRNDFRAIAGYLLPGSMNAFTTVDLWVEVDQGTWDNSKLTSASLPLEWVRQQIVDYWLQGRGTVTDNWNWCNDPANFLNVMYPFLCPAPFKYDAPWSGNQMSAGEAPVTSPDSLVGGKDLDQWVDQIVVN